MARSTNVSHGVSKQLERVQLEIDRLFQSLANLNPDLPPEHVSPEWIRATIEARRRRGKIFGARFLGESPWDILLELYARKLEGSRATITDLCAAAAIPFPTGHRWLTELESEGLITRTRDTEDLRRVFVELSERASAGMEAYFGDGAAGSGKRDPSPIATGSGHRASKQDTKRREAKA